MIILHLPCLQICSILGPLLTLTWWLISFFHWENSCYRELLCASSTKALLLPTSGLIQSSFPLLLGVRLSYSTASPAPTQVHCIPFPFVYSRQHTSNCSFFLWWHKLLFYRIISVNTRMCCSISHLRKQMKPEINQIKPSLVCESTSNGYFIYSL